MRKMVLAAVLATVGWLALTAALAIDISIGVVILIGGDPIGLGFLAGGVAIGPGCLIMFDSICESWELVADLHKNRRG